jgi:hypothetical protein
MTEESAKQMTWHKDCVRYRPDNMVHPADADAWKYFDDQHKAKPVKLEMYVLRWLQMGSILMD